MAFAVGVAQDLGLPDSSFDIVTCTLAVHHLPAGLRLPLCGVSSAWLAGG
jgi:hypothetical protein